MGMAASQARYLSLVARKTNVEWEGQQINQSRTALANKTASLFNQMLGMQVPDCPDCTDFTTVQYSFSDGLNASVIDKYYQLSAPDPEYNYVVTHHYNTNVYTGSVKKLNDPQVNFGDESYNVPERSKTEEYAAAVNARPSLTKAYNIAKLELRNRVYDNPATHKELGGGTGDTLTESAGVYTYTDNDQASGQGTYNFNPIAADDTSHDADLLALIQEGVFADYKDESKLDALRAAVLYDADSGNYALRADLADITDIESETFDAYNPQKTSEDAAKNYIKAKKAMEDNQAIITEYEETYAINPKYVGNCELTELHELTDDELAELSQCLKDFEKNGYTTNLQNYFHDNPISTDYFSPYEYDGSGVYKFVLNGVTQYTTMADLAMSYINANDPPGNDIDSQFKLEYYNASYIETPIEKTERALLETDGQGRFKSVRFEDDSVTYTLNCETKVDEDSYNDAMNQYYHKVYLYEKAIADINAKTEIIQNQDRTLELRLKQLDTEQSALTNEIDAVKKVLKDNIEKSFKTFGE